MRRDVPDIADGLLLTGLPAACEGGTPPVSLSDAKPPADAEADAGGDAVATNDARARCP
jgi:hypothetical protein